jgi:hypothetical protein
MVPVAFADRDLLKAFAREFRNLVEELPEETSFTTAVGRATADRQRMLFRIGRVAAGIESIGVPIDLPAPISLQLDTPDSE